MAKYSALTRYSVLSNEAATLPFAEDAIGGFGVRIEKIGIPEETVGLRRWCDLKK
jgi:hypothetical protein